MIRIADAPFDPTADLAGFGAASGAVVSFVGRVRARDGDGRAVETLTLEHYPGLTERSIVDIEAEARARWPLEDVLIVHRVGRLAPGAPIVLVATAAAHRRAAFEAADFLMDYLKTEALFWKKETGESGARWIEPRGRDYRDAERWGAAAAGTASEEKSSNEK